MKQIRRRLRRGERISDLAVEFSVNRKTIRRRLNQLAQAETEEHGVRHKRRLRRQVVRGLAGDAEAAFGARARRG